MLLTLKNLMRQAHDRELRGEATPEPGKAPEKPPEKPAPRPTTRTIDRDGEVELDAVRPAVSLKGGAKVPAARKPPPQQAKPAASAQGDGKSGSLVSELEKLVSLRQQGILTEEEFQTLKKRLVAGAR
jgi:hypothetical protein